MYSNDTFMYILDLCGSLSINELECLIGNIETMIENLKEEEE